jgi:hypothetical protein
MNRVISFINRNPWLYVVLAFGLLIAAWSTLDHAGGRAHARNH